MAETLADLIKRDNLDVGYSTDEQFTGEYWINGKPIYRKVFTGTLPSTGGTFPSTTGQQSVSVGASVDEFVSISGVATLVSGGCIPVSAVHTSTVYFTVWGRNHSNSSPNQVAYCCGSGMTNSSFIIIIEYTKTTD